MGYPLRISHHKCWNPPSTTAHQNPLAKSNEMQWSWKLASSRVTGLQVWVSIQIILWLQPLYFKKILATFCNTLSYTGVYIYIYTVYIIFWGSLFPPILSCTVKFITSGSTQMINDLQIILTRLKLITSPACLSPIWKLFQTGSLTYHLPTNWYHWKFH